jgi:YD repeat-containing protein
MYFFMKNVMICILLLLAAMNTSAQSVTYTYDNAGNRTARVITMNSAPAQAPEAMTVFSDLVAEKAILIYPNPTDGILTVEIKDYTDEVRAEFRLTDLSGRTILSRKATAGFQTFDLSREAAGIYLLQIRINGESTVWKIVKK